MNFKNPVPESLVKDMTPRAIRKAMYEEIQRSKEVKEFQADFHKRIAELTVKKEQP